MDRYAVFGNPIAHSQSPRIHALFAEQTGERLDYQRTLVAKGGFAEQAAAFFASGGRGLNVTVPFKEDAVDFADALTARAQLAGALNTLALRDDGTVLGDNTDGAGLMLDLARLAWTPRAWRVLVVGAGGAARGIMQPLLASAPASVVVANRTLEKAQKLAARFASEGPVTAVALDALREPFELIINATSSALQGEAPPLADRVVAGTTCAYDLMYAAQPTPFMRWAEQKGARQSSDGLGMLVGQAAESFALWRGKMPNIEPVLATLRESIR